MPSVPCHLPHNGIGYPAGSGQKTHDWLVCDCCLHCHHELDHGIWRNDHQIRMRAHCRTIERRIDEGILQVAGERHERPEFCMDGPF